MISMQTSFHLADTIPSGVSVPGIVSDNPASAKKNRSILCLKGIGIIAVVAHHIANRRFDEGRRDWIGLLGLVADWCVPLFIVIAGYLHGLSYCRGKTSPLVFFKSRCLRLLLPFIVVSCVYSALYRLLFLAGFTGNRAEESISWYIIWIRTLAGQSGGVGEQLYFLPLLFIVSVVSAFVITVCRGRVSLMIIGATIFMSVGFLSSYLIDMPSSVLYWPYDLIVFAFGVYILSFVFAIRASTQSLISILMVCMCILSLLLERIDSFNICFPLFLLFSFLYLGVDNRWLGYVGHASGTIFLYHTPFILQPLLVFAAVLLPPVLHVFSAYAILSIIIILGTLAHFKIIRGKISWLRF